MLHLTAINHMQSLLEEKPAELGHDPRVLLGFFEGLQVLVQGLSGSFNRVCLVIRTPVRVCLDRTISR